MKYSIEQVGDSRSFLQGDVFLSGASDDAEVSAASDAAEVVAYLGAFHRSGGAYQPDDSKLAILVELDIECLGVHTGEQAGEEGSNVIGFARYRNGEDAPSDLIELVRQPNTRESAIDAARQVFEEAGLEVVVCSDQAGRIIDRLLRPKYNAALRFLDEGLASAKDMDLTCRLGLGYRDGPIERVERGGLARHYQITQALFETYGTPGFAPARRSVVARQRKED
jgi:3-hydroxybutyryl-CoA dehydrogenase